MKKSITRRLLICAVLVPLLLFATPAQAASYRIVNSSSHNSADTRTIHGIIFKTSYQSGSETYTLTTTKNGLVNTLYRGKSLTAIILTNASTVYFTAGTNSSGDLYKTNVNGSRLKKIATLSKNGSADLCACYGGKIYYIENMPEGTLLSYDLSTGKKKKWKSGVSSATKKGKYLILNDGTGAGYGYLGVLNAKKGSVKTVSKKPYMWVNTSSHIYYAEIVSGNLWDAVKIRVRRYNLATGKKKNLMSARKTYGIKKITKKYVIYYTSASRTSTKTFRWQAG